MTSCPAWDAAAARVDASRRAPVTPDPHPLPRFDKLNNVQASIVCEVAATCDDASGVLERMARVALDGKGMERVWRWVWARKAVLGVEAIVAPRHLNTVIWYAALDRAARLCAAQ